MNIKEEEETVCIATSMYTVPLALRQEEDTFLYDRQVGQVMMTGRRPQHSC